VRTLVLSGNGFEDDGEDLLIELVSELSGPTASASLSEPGSVRQLARRVAALRHPLGIVARFKRRATRVVLRSSAVRFDGRVKLRLRVVPARR
jgi:hypothetical protein